MSCLHASMNRGFEEANEEIARQRGEVNGGEGEGGCWAEGGGDKERSEGAITQRLRTTRACPPSPASPTPAPFLAPVPSQLNSEMNDMKMRSEARDADISGRFAAVSQQVVTSMKAAGDHTNSTARIVKSEVLEQVTAVKREFATFKTEVYKANKANEARSKLVEEHGKAEKKAEEEAAKAKQARAAKLAEDLRTLP